MKKNRQFIAPFAEQNKFSSETFTAPALDALERKVRFSLKHCDTKKNYCISTISSDKILLTDLYKRLGHFEDMTWRIAKTMPREDGISIEKHSSTNYRDMASSYSDFDTFGHLRVSSSKKPIFRIFGAVREDLFYILRFDVDGVINHK